MLQVHSQRGVAYETNALHIWIQFHGALRARNAHITVYDITTWSWVNLVHPSLVPRHPIFHTRPAALSKNRVWTRSLVKLRLNLTTVLACCRTNQIAQVK